MHPLKIAYNEYMRAYTGCIRTTPIALLHAISNFPLLKDKIQTDTATAVLKAIAQENRLGKDLEEWVKKEFPVPGWTPFGMVQKAVEKMENCLESAI